MATKPNNPIVNIRTELYQPDQPGSDLPDFVYKKGEEYRLFIVTYADGSGRIYKSIEPEVTNG